MIGIYLDVAMGNGFEVEGYPYSLDERAEPRAVECEGGIGAGGVSVCFGELEGCTGGGGWSC